jgi:hypothetical protein
MLVLAGAPKRRALALAYRSQSESPLYPLLCSDLASGRARLAFLGHSQPVGPQGFGPESERHSGGSAEERLHGCVRQPQRLGAEE